MTTQAGRALVVERLTVRPDRVVCELTVAADVARTTTPALVARVCAAHPSLPRHACVNEKGDTFGAVIDCTPLPHLFEHLVIDLQTRSSADPDAVFVGTSEWLDEVAGRARIEVSFADDLLALRAFRDASALLNAAVLP